MNFEKRRLEWNIEMLKELKKNIKNCSGVGCLEEIKTENNTADEKKSVIGGVLATVIIYLEELRDIKFDRENIDRPKDI